MIFFLILQIPIITLRMLDRYDRYFGSNIVKDYLFIEYLDLFFRSLWVAFDLTIVVIYFLLIRFFVKRRNEAQRKKAIKTGINERDGPDWHKIVTVGFAILGGIFVIEYAITSYVYTIILL